MKRTQTRPIHEPVDANRASSDDADRLTSFRAALDGLVGTPVRLPDGATYVEAIRPSDAERQTELDRERLTQ